MVWQKFMGDDSFEMLVRWVKEAGIIKEDVPLAPLSNIISSVEDEIQKGHVEHCRLYLSVYQHHDKQEYLGWFDKSLMHMFPSGNL